MNDQKRMASLKNSFLTQSNCRSAWGKHTKQIIKNYLFKLSIVSLVLTLIVPFRSTPASAAQSTLAFIRQVRAIESAEAGVFSPTGLVFSSRANAFQIMEKESGSGSSDLVKLTPFTERAGSARLAAMIKDPINLALDNRAGRLLILHSSAKQLLEVYEDANGNLDPNTLTRHDIEHLNLQDPQGLAFDEARGVLYILDAAAPHILRMELGIDGSFEGAGLSVIDLASSGLVAPRGLAFEPGTGTLHVVLPGEQKLVELNQIGEVVATRDLSEFGLKAPQGVVFAPSSDQTDDPSQFNLFLADSGQSAEQATLGSQSTGQIMELSLTQPVEAAVASFTSSIVRTTDMSAISPPSPDPSGIAYLSGNNRLMVTDGEVEETVNNITHFQGANVWELTLGGSKVRTANISKKAPTVVPMTDEPTGVTWNPGNGHYFFTEDGGKRVYDLNPGADGLVGTGDLNEGWTFFSTTTAGNGDPEGIAFDTWRNRLFVADGVNREVYEYTLTGNPVGHFDVATYGVDDPESVEFNPDSGTLFVMSSNRSSPIIVETTVTGALIQTINISATNARQAAGLAYAPASNGSGAKRFYIVDRAIDNNSDPRIVDGKMYEMTAPGGGAPGNTPPLVSAGSDQTITLPNSANLNGTVSDDGLPNPPAAVTTTWSKVNGPGTVTFGDASAVDTTASFSTAGSYTLRLTGDDSALSNSDDVIITVNSGSTSDLIFADSFESGNLSAWTSNANDLGDLSASTTAALVGSQGMRAFIDDNTFIYVTDDTPNAEPRYRARFYFGPNSITMASGDNHFIFYGYSGTSTIVLRVQLRFSNGNYQWRAALRNDASTWTNTSWFTISDAVHFIELDWRAATAAGANNGGLTLWIDNTQQANLTGVDNDTWRIDRARLGAVAGVDTGTRGTYYVDAFDSRRQNFIGP